MLQVYDFVISSNISIRDMQSFYCKVSILVFFLLYDQVALSFFVQVTPYVVISVLLRLYLLALRLVSLKINLLTVEMVLPLASKLEQKVNEKMRFTF